jgi:hypothetical protein
MSLLSPKVPSGTPSIKPRRPVNRIITRGTSYQSYLEEFYRGKEALLAEYNRLKLLGIFGSEADRKTAESQAFREADELFEKYRKEAEERYEDLRKDMTASARSAVQNTLRS